MAPDSEIICQLKQQIVDSWHDHDGGTPAEAARHYAEEARLNPVFDDSGALEGEEQIRAWFAFQRQKFSAEDRWDFQHRVIGSQFQLQGQWVKSRQQLLTTGQKRQEDGRIRTFMVPGHGSDVWISINGVWKILSRTIEVDFAFYRDPASMNPLGFLKSSNDKKEEH